MTDWQKQLITLCTQARIVAMNSDVTAKEKRDLIHMAEQVERDVIRQVNARS